MVLEEKGRGLMREWVQVKGNEFRGKEYNVWKVLWENQLRLMETSEE